MKFIILAIISFIIVVSAEFRLITDQLDLDNILCEKCPDYVKSDIMHYSKIMTQEGSFCFSFYLNEKDPSKKCYFVTASKHEVFKVYRDQDGEIICSLYGYIPSTDSISYYLSYSIGIDLDSKGNVYIFNTGVDNSYNYGSVWKIPANTPNVSSTDISSEVYSDSPIEAVRIYKLKHKDEMKHASELIVNEKRNSLIVTSYVDNKVLQISLDGKVSEIINEYDEGDIYDFEVEGDQYIQSILNLDEEIAY